LIADLEALSRRFAEAHSEARWLWRSGKVCRGGWIPWEVQVNNAAPQALIWKADSETITCTAPGLYHVRVGVFTQNTASVQLCVNGEPILTLEPNTEVSNETRVKTRDSGLEHVKRRNRHSAGDITCVGVSEIVALPPNAMVGVRYDCSTRAQGYCIIRKL
jgi:hypothetical protein